MKQEDKLSKHLFAGAIAGAVSRTVTAPLDRLKVYLQVRGAEFANLRNCFKILTKDGGYISLWRGNGINVIKIAPETAMKFMAYEQAKRFIRENHNDSELTIGQRFLAGAIAGSTSQTVIYPMEVVKTKLVLRQTGDHRGIMHCAKKIMHYNGIRGFYRGYIPNLIGIIPYAGVDLAVYETLKRSYLKSHENEKRKLPQNEAQIYVLLICGIISSSCGQLCSYPLALIRTRLQAISGSDHHNVSMTTLFKEIYDKEGIRGFYRGIVPNFMKVAPAVSISYVVYERTRLFLGAEMC